MSGPGLAVAFVGGYGRSGSTLLDRVLGAVDGFVSLGELRHVWREGFVEDRRCGCGAPFHACRFWRDVMADAFGGLERVDVAAVRALQRRVDRWWRTPQIAAARPNGFRADLAEYREILASVYRSVRRVSGARVVVDSTKDVSHGYVIRDLAPDIDTRVIHLVRDSRAVAYSWSRRAKFDPGRGVAMDRHGLLRTGLEWSAINALTAIGHARGRYLRLRYEDLAREPRRALESVLAFLSAADREAPIEGERAVVLRPQHQVAGNPHRFERGTATISADEEWRERMPPWGRATVAALTAPGLLRFGYGLRGRA